MSMEIICWFDNENIRIETVANDDCNGSAKSDMQTAEIFKENHIVIKKKEKKRRKLNILGTKLIFSKSNLRKR